MDAELTTLLKLLGECALLDGMFSKIIAILRGKKGIFEVFRG
jgi:hypothetical protein